MLFYRHVVLNRVIYEINAQENKRQEVMDNGEAIVDKFGDNINDLKTNLISYSRKSKVLFIVKDIEGKEILKVPFKFKTISKIKEQQYIRKSGKVAYILYGYFPPKLELKDNFNENKDRIFIGFTILLIALLCDFLIYKLIAEPIRNLSKAISKLNYGNTINEIPYYSDDEFGQLCRSFEDMGKRLKSSEENQQQLIQAMSHDIKTPLTSIIGYSKRLVEGKVAEHKKNEYYSIIYRKATDLKYLLGELDDYASLNSSEKYHFTVFNLTEYYNKVYYKLSLELSSKECKFSYDELENSYGNQQICIKVDEKKMNRVFTNIVQNCIKYAGSNCSINLKAYADENWVYFEVRDNGHGVPEEQLNKIFERFYRVETSRSREKGGTGLGLAICKDILVCHEGNIYGENLPDGGFAITIYLPIYREIKLLP